MVQIFVYARVGNTRNFIGIFNDMESLKPDVWDELNRINRPNWESSTFFLLNDKEYKLFPEDE